MNGQEVFLAGAVAGNLEKSGSMTVLGHALTEPPAILVRIDCFPDEVFRLTVEALTE